MDKKRIISIFFLILILSGFFYLYNYLNFHNNSQPLIFNSPDETANYFFTENFKENNNLQKQSSLLEINSDIKPRSIKAVDDKLVLNSFIGLPLIYGSIAKIFGNNLIIYLSSLIALLGVIVFYLLIKEIFNQKIALISGLLLLILPSYWYFANRGMMHNVLFIDLLIFSLYFFILALKKPKLIYYLLSGLFLALCLLTRTSEFIWIALIYLSLLIFLRQKINWKKLILSILIFIICLIPLFYFNQQNYGASMASPYLENKPLSLNLQSISKIILPFGFHPNNIKFTIYNFIFKLPWHYTLLILAGLIMLIWQRKKIKPEHWLYFGLWVLLSLFLFIYYGSWLFFDNPNPSSITIGSSYLRYLLPYFVFGLPLIAWLLSKIKFSKKYLNNLIIFTLLAFMFFNSYLLVMSCPEEGIIKISQDLKNYQYRTRLIINNTEINSIIMTSRADKYIFPYRNVLYLEKEVYDYNNFDSLRNANIPLYYFGFQFSAIDIKNVKYKFYEQGLDISAPIFTHQDHALYKIMSINQIYALDR